MAYSNFYSINIPTNIKISKEEICNFLQEERMTSFIDKHTKINAEFKEKNFSLLSYSIKIAKEKNFTLSTDKWDVLIQNTDNSIISENGWDNLMTALFNSKNISLSPETLDFLIKNNNLQLANKDGWSALMIACRYVDKNNLRLDSWKKLIFNSNLNQFNNYNLNASTYVLQAILDNKFKADDEIVDFLVNNIDFSTKQTKENYPIKIFLENQNLLPLTLSQKEKLITKTKINDVDLLDSLLIINEKTPFSIEEWKIIKNRINLENVSIKADSITKTKFLQLLKKSISFEVFMEENIDFVNKYNLLNFICADDCFYKNIACSNYNLEIPYDYYAKAIKNINFSEQELLLILNKNDILFKEFNLIHRNDFDLAYAALKKDINNFKYVGSELKEALNINEENALEKLDAFKEEKTKGFFGLFKKNKILNLQKQINKIIMDNFERRLNISYINEEYSLNKKNLNTEENIIVLNLINKVNKMNDLGLNLLNDYDNSDLKKIIEINFITLLKNYAKLTEDNRLKREEFNDSPKENFIKTTERIQERIDVFFNKIQEKLILNVSKENAVIHFENLKDETEKASFLERKNKL